LVFGLASVYFRVNRQVLRKP